jgi:hypothetical protein
MGRRLLAASLLVLIGVVAVGAEDTAAYRTLRAAPRFAVGHVGRAGSTSDEEAALRSLLSHPHASADLRRLLSQATLAGQLYALWGLAVLREDDFEKQSEKYASSDQQVETMNGCLVEWESVSSIVRRIRDGAYGKPAD